MKEVTDVCEHCGNLNRTGALHCDGCGKGLSANLAAKYREQTRYGWYSLVVCGASVALATLGIKYSDDFNYGYVRYISAFLIFAFCVVAMFSFASCIGLFLTRGKYRYSDSEELAATQDSVNATSRNLPAGYVVCPSCGNIANPKKEPVCKYCNCDLLAEGSRRVTSRLSDGELLVRIQRYQTQGLCFLFTALPVMFAGIIVLVVSGNEEFTAVSAVGVSLITLGFLGIWRAIVVNNVATEMFKVNVVRDALAEVLEGCVYKSKLSISQPRIAATGLFEGWNRFSGEDYIRGAYQGHEIEFSDIVLENEHTEGTGDRKRTVKTTVFQGPWLTCRLRKKLPAKVVLREGGGKGNVETESVAFNSKYQLLTDDPHTLFRVLTPHFMEYVVAADEELNARTFFCFAGDRVHIAVFNKHNSFEIPANNNAGNLDAAREQIKKEMRSIIEMLDVLLRNEFLL